MKKIMKVVSLILTFALLVSMVVVPSVTTSAKGATGDCSITIKPSAAGPSDISTRKFVAYRVLEATVEGDSVGYSICSEIEGYKGVLLEAIKAVDASYAAGLTDGSSEAEVLDAIRKMEETSDFDMEKFAKALLKGIEGKVAEESSGGPFTTAFKVGETEDDNGDHVYFSGADGSNAKFEGLKSGYYLIKDTSTASDNTVVSALMLTTTTPNKEIVAKTSEPYVEKNIVSGANNYDSDTVKIGDTVSYKIESVVPDVHGYETYNYIITDTLDAGLTYSANTIQVQLQKAGGSTEDLLTKGALTSSATNCTVTVAGQVITVTFSLADLKALKDAGHVGDKILITYDAKINERASVGLDNPTKNNVKLQYGNDPSSSTTATPKEDTVNTYTFGLVINKQDADSGHDPLSGATFRIYYLRGAQKYYAKFVDDPDTSDDDNNNKIIQSWITNPGPKEETNYNFVTGDDGTVKITGLDAETTYYLEEIIAPDGHKLLVDPIQLKVTPTWAGGDANRNDLTSATMTKENYTENDNVVNIKQATVNKSTNTDNFEVTIANTKGIALPETGGMGTTLLYTIGGVLVVIAGVLLITKKRMSVTR